MIQVVEMGVSFILILMFVILVDSLYLPDVTPSKVENGTGEEIQHAICKITSKDLEATANATVFRELKGVCTSVELQNNLNQIESRILQELDTIKNILRENGFKVSQVQQPPPIYLSQVFQPMASSYKSAAESLQRTSITEKQLLTRLQEIHNYNDTVVESNKGSIYFYYWNIENVDTLLTKAEMYTSSPEFVVLGHSLHLQFYPNYLDQGSFGIQLRPSSRGFVKKHKIYIVNQVDTSLDIDSGLMFGFKEESLFRVSEEIIHEPGYIIKRTMIVKLEIFLNS